MHLQQSMESHFDARLSFLFCMVTTQAPTTFRSSIMSVLHEADVAIFTSFHLFCSLTITVWAEQRYCNSLVPLYREIQPG